MDKDKIDLLKKAEDLTVNLNKFFNKKGKSVFDRYPVVFTILVIFGVTMIGQGIQGLIQKIPLLNEKPHIMLLAGLVILIVTGSLYKKLEE